MKQYFTYRAREQQKDDRETQQKRKLMNFTPDQINQLKRNPCDVIIDEYLDVKHMSNKIFCCIPDKRFDKKVSSDLKFAMNAHQRKTLDTEDIYNYMFTNLRNSHLSKMEEQVGQKLQQFHIEMQELEKSFETDLKDSPDFVAMYEYLNP